MKFRNGILACLLASLAVLAAVSASGVFAQTEESERASFSSPHAEFVPGEVLVRFRRGAPALAASVSAPTRLALRAREGEELSAEVSRFGGSELVEGLRLVRVAPAETIKAVKAFNARPDVLYAEPNYIYKPELTPNDPQFTHPNMYGLSKIGAPQAWDTTQGSQSVVVGVIDGGIDRQHEDLQANMWVNTGEVAGNGLDDDGDGYIDDVNGFNLINNNGTIFVSATDDDHGTHVAGTIGARGNNGVGVTGVNWQVSLMSIKVCNAAGCPNAAILGGYQYALKMKRDKGVNLRVLNNSYGGVGFSQAALDAIQSLGNQGILFVAAAGNESLDNFSVPHYPSSYDLPNVIGVASTNSVDGLSGFSNFGVRVVSMGAPGSNILSTTPRNYSQQNTGITGANGATYSIFSGTSMAAPHVSGAAALVVAAKPGISMQELRGVLAYSGDVVGSLSATTTTGRRLNVAKSIASALENDTTPPATPTLQLVSQTGRHLTVSWTEPGDDGFSGQAADHDFIYTDTATGARTVLPIGFFGMQPGTSATATLDVPYLSFSGSVEMRVYDNAGNFSSSTLPFSVGDNILSNPYTVTEGAGGGLSTGGTRLNIDGDDRYQRNITLPFNFPYFSGQTLNQVAVSSNGTIYFTPPNPPSRATLDDADDVPSEVATLRGQRMLAVMWDDLLIDTSVRADAGVYQVTTANSVIFRWQGTQFDAATSPVNFEAELRNDGTIIYRYGSGNSNLFPVVGVASGEPEPYVVSSHTSERTRPGATRISLGNASSVTFTRRTNASNIQFSSANYTVAEDAGVATITITRTGNLDTSQFVSFGTVDAGGTATPGTDFTSTATLVTFNSGESSKTVNVGIINDTATEPTETVGLILANPGNNASLGTPSTATLSITDDDVAGPNNVQFNSPNTTVSESAGKLTVTVTRTGVTTSAATVFYRTVSGTASERTDYTAAAGTLRFGANETSKTFDVLLTDDRFDESDESFNITLSDASQTTIGTPSTFTVNVTDDDSATGPSPVRWDSNFDVPFFVRQHYADFLNREADAAGLAFWSNEITSCGANQACIETRRVNVSGAFFQAIEFQETGYLSYRTYKAAYGNAQGTYRDGNGIQNAILVPVIRLEEFLADTRRLGDGVIVGQGNWAQQLELNKTAYFEEFVARTRFTNAAPASMTPAQFVDALYANAGVTPNSSQREFAINQFGPGASNTADRAARGRVLRFVAEDPALNQLERNRAFVTMQFFGYLRRNPNDPQDTDYTGWKFWLDKLNQANGNFVSAEMVKAFITADEYRNRFGN